MSPGVMNVLLRVTDDELDNVSESCTREQNLSCPSKGTGSCCGLCRLAGSVCISAASSCKLVWHCANPWEITGTSVCKSVGFGDRAGGQCNGSRLLGSPVRPWVGHCTLLKYQLKPFFFLCFAVRLLPLALSKRCLLSLPHFPQVGYRRDAQHTRG